MFGKKQIEKKRAAFKNLNFSSLTNKYWKGQVFFYILTTLSCLGSFIITQNISQILSERKQRFLFLGYKSRIFNTSFSEFKRVCSGVVLLSVFLYFSIVFSHVWFALHLEAKVRRYLKKLIVRKMFRVEGSYDKKKISPLLNYSVQLFSKNVFFIPNQLYYVGLEILLAVFSNLSKSKKGEVGSGSATSISSVRMVFFSYLLLFFLVCAVSQLFLYYVELRYHNSIENEVKNELFLVENSDLIIKKNQFPEFSKTYSKSLDGIFYGAIVRNLSETFSFVFPSYFLLKLFPFVCLYYSDVLDSSVTSSIFSFSDVFNNIRKLIERGRDFPFYYSSQRRLNEFLSRGERDDKQSGLTIPAPIQSIRFKDISFTHQNKGNRRLPKKVLDNFSISFEVGKINEMNFPNGFGKSTIVNLVTGMLKTQSGGIMINEIYNLCNIDLRWWRTNISYSEHRNLISRLDLSTGQKQLIDLDHVFKNKEKQVFIFDEADSSLDHKNRNEFLDKLKELSTKKIVILVSHYTEK